MSAIPPTPVDAADLDSEPHLADALAHAERRRAMLERLSVIGMQLAEQVGAHSAAAMAAINEDKGGDPTRAFATISRAIRLTVALEARVGAQILALRNGRLPAGWAPGSRVAPCERRVHDGARGGEAGNSLRPERENLTDSDPVEDFELSTFGQAVAAIRADLDLEPESNGWLDDEGFANYDTEESSLPFMGRVETERSEVRGGEVRFIPDTFVSTQTSAPTIQTPPPRSASPSRPSP